MIGIDWNSWWAGEFQKWKILGSHFVFVFLKKNALPDLSILQWLGQLIQILSSNELILFTCKLFSPYWVLLELQIFSIYTTKHWSYLRCQACNDFNLNWSKIHTTHPIFFGWVDICRRFVGHKLTTFSRFTFTATSLYV